MSFFAAQNKKDENKRETDAKCTGRAELQEVEREPEDLVEVGEKVSCEKEKETEDHESEVEEDTQVQSEG